jgi:hypothetical protein
MTTPSKLAIAAAVALLVGCATSHPRNVRLSGEGVDSSAAWASLDSDNNASLSLDEIRQQRAMGLLQDLPNADTDHDQRISRTEWDAWWPRMTDHYVRDADERLPAPSE